MRTVYLAGPMENVSIEEAQKWREKATRILAGNDFKVLDPTRRIHSFQQKEFKKIFELDLRDIRESDVLLVDLSDPKVAKNGTAIEVFYANFVLHKQVIGFKSDPTVKHPFFEQLVTEWFPDVETAAWAIVGEYE
jgi:nucleoside 2-deoxyribosyltransferase